MTKIDVDLDYSKIDNTNSSSLSDSNEEKKLDELDGLFPKIMELKAQEDLLLGFPVTKYDSQKKNYYKLYPDGKKIYG